MLALCQILSFVSSIIIESSYCILALCHLHIWQTHHLWFSGTRLSTWELSSFSSWGKWDTERLRNLSEITQQGHGVSELVPRAYLLKYCESSHNHWNFSVSLFFFNPEFNLTSCQNTKITLERQGINRNFGLDQPGSNVGSSTGCVTLAKSLNFLVFQFSPL